ncbi:Gtp-binding protein brassinazole insensitive pale green 2 protein [Thalictrum thalictroides]|uniref:Gtp-binding protein brassinazole insensitive pale green 2 protein n=1 Tax=Thalictrum thalictroides TaxID=46969 RepID=A0A7J6XE39_THATH|nr:Gtp-binding protein brassinazole insensitive pale green 2 protein [Thalictrum thalictroides]
MQESNPKLPGYFIIPSAKSIDYKPQINRQPIAEEPEISNSFKRGNLKELVEPEIPGPNPNPKPLVCVRCHSLRHYGKISMARSLENLRNWYQIQSMKIRLWKHGKSGNVPRVVLVVTKIDLLPPSLSPTHLKHWVRQRAREGGANKLTSVHLVSSFRDWGVKNLVDDVCKLAGARGNVWAIGAQNAGKSTLINSIGKHISGKNIQLTEAPVPGTTLGIIRVEGVLPGKAKLFDTPGLLHPHQITTRLTREEQKLVHVSEELRPRTYRIKAGHTVHIAGLMRLDVEEASAESIYITVWASPYLPLHMGKTENVDTMLEDHFGRQLQPPIGENRAEELGQWVRKEFHVRGNSWDVSSVDVAATGVGWFAVGLKGEAVLGVRTYDGVHVILRNSLIPQRAQFFEIAGFTVSKVVSNADQVSNKQRQSKKPKNQIELKETASEALRTCM